jgi:large subunit ribosomal protein L2
MLIKKKKTSNGVRHQLNFKKFLLSKNSSIQKNLSKGCKKTQSGRSSLFGKITVYNKGGGSKKLFREISNKSDNLYSLIISIIYDPRRNSFISFCYNFLTLKFYNCVTTNNTFPGSLLYSFYLLPELKLGINLQLKNVPPGSILHSICSSNKSKYIKSSGAFGILIQKKSIDCKIKMPSGAIKDFFSISNCILGSVYNTLRNVTVYGKAGRSRLLGKRPKVRGVAMNPVDHPHGGQTAGGITPVTPWGIPTRGKKTRKMKN